MHSSTISKLLFAANSWGSIIGEHKTSASVAGFILWQSQISISQLTNTKTPLLPLTKLVKVHHATGMAPHQFVLGAAVLLGVLPAARIPAVMELAAGNNTLDL